VRTQGQKPAELLFRRRAVAAFDLPVGLNLSLKVTHTPGHSKGHLALFCAEDGALFSGDSIPMAGSLPIYEGVLASVKLLRKLKAVEGEKFLLSSWDEPRLSKIEDAIDQGLAYLQRIHEVVLREKNASPSCDSMELAPRVQKSLRLPEAALNPIVIRSIEAHLQASDHTEDLPPLPTTAARTRRTGSAARQYDAGDDARHDGKGERPARPSNPNIAWQAT
jgi:hypothetical protein